MYTPAWSTGLAVELFAITGVDACLLQTQAYCSKADNTTGTLHVVQNCYFLYFVK
jgi:hypothetical protein